MPNKPCCERCGERVREHLYRVERRRRRFDRAGRLVASESVKGFESLCSTCYRRIFNDQSG